MSAAQDASWWWSRGAQTSHHGGGGFMHGGGMAGSHYPYQQQVGGGHYFGQQNVGPEMVQLPFSRPRLRWSKELHDKFVSAVNQLGGATNATPKTIWNIMQVEGLTLFQIKSHLQKYRLGKIGRRSLRRDVVPNGGRNIEDELPENESIDTEGYQGFSDISDMNGDERLEAQKYGNLNHLVESQTSVKNSEMTENPPPLTADPHYFPEWYELLPHLINSSMDDYLNSVGYSSELAFTGTRDSSRSSIMFGSFFDEVARLPKNIEDDLMMDNNVVAMDAHEPIYVNY